MHRKTEPSPTKAKPPSLRRRLIIALAVPLAIILAASSLLDFRLARETSDSAHDQALADTVFDIESHLRSHSEPESPEFDLTAESEAMLRSNAPDKVYFSIRDSSGRILSGDDDIPPFEIPKTNGVFFEDGVHRGEAVRIALHRFSLPGSELLITVMETTEKRKESRGRILTAMLLPTLAVIVATLLAVRFGVRRGLVPLEEVEKAIASRSPNDLREIDLDTAPREIQPMLRRLNELFSLLREASAVQNRFIADAAHQLRTPLAGLQTQFDLAVNEGAFKNNNSRLENIEDGMLRIGRLLGQLLSYARAEATASLADEPTSVSLDRIAEKSASIFLDAALEKGIDLGFDIAPATTIGIPWLLQEALANLIDNAIRYTPRGGIITVRCGETAEMAFLEVEDNGPGIANEHLGQIFERFYRIPGSPSNGCGLGLPIVKEIASLHDAVIHVMRSSDRGLRVRLEFPRKCNPR
jgi:two-component system, OmpR family, sensor histidine kinase TctE